MSKPSFLTKLGSALAEAELTTNLAFLDRQLEMGAVMGEILSPEGSATGLAMVIGYTLAGGKWLPPYLTADTSKPVIYCNARLTSSAGYRLLAEIHARNEDDKSKQLVDQNLNVLFRRDYPKDFPGFFNGEGKNDLFSLIGDKPGLLIIDDAISNKEHPYDNDYSWSGLNSTLATLKQRGWTILVLRDLYNKDRSKGFDTYSRMIDFRITANTAKGGTAQGETRLVLTHQLMGDYDPALLGAHIWTAGHQDGKYIFSIDPCADPIAERNAEIIAELANGKTMASVARQFGLDKTSIGRVAGLYPRKRK